MTRYVRVTDAVTGDLLSYYEVPAEGYVEFLKAVDAAALSVGSLRCSVIDLRSPSRIMPSEQNGNAFERAEKPLKVRGGGLANMDLAILEHLWLNEGKPLSKRDIASKLGYTPNQVEYSIRKKLKKHGLVVAGKNVGDDGGNIASSFYVNRDAVLLKFEQLYAASGFDVRAYDLNAADGVSLMFSDLRKALS